MKNEIIISQKDINIINKLQKGTSLQRKACEIFQLLLLNANFKDFIFEIRQEEGIPSKGLDLNKEKGKRIIAEKFFNNKYLLHHKESIEIPGLVFNRGETFSKINDFIEKENILSMISTSTDNIFLNDLVFSIIKEYIILNDIIRVKNGVGMIYRTNYEEEDMPDEITLLISSTATKDQLIDYINVNWEEIKILQESILGEEKVKKRLKLSKYFVRDIEIYNKYIDLLEKKNRGEIDFKYIDMEIAKEFEGLDEGTIRSIISKIKKLTKSINEKKEQNNVEDKGEVLF